MSKLLEGLRQALICWSFSTAFVTLTYFVLATCVDPHRHVFTPRVVSILSLFTGTLMTPFGGMIVASKFKWRNAFWDALMRP